MSNLYVAGTRYFESNPEKALESSDRLHRWADFQLNAGAQHVYIAVNTGKDQSHALSQTWPEQVELLSVPVWGEFVLPLNSLIAAARDFLAKGLPMLISSVEVLITPAIVAKLQSYMGPDVIAVGAAFPGHSFFPGVHSPANGREVFWNTGTLYNPASFCLGFPLVGDGPIADRDSKGVEELAFLGLHQKLFGGKAILTPVPGLSWDVSSFDPDRLAAHEKKMASKITRPEAQLAYLASRGAVLCPTMIHVG